MSERNQYRQNLSQDTEQIINDLGLPSTVWKKLGDEPRLTRDVLVEQLEEAMQIEHSFPLKYEDLRQESINNLLLVFQMEEESQAQILGTFTARESIDFEKKVTPMRYAQRGDEIHNFRDMQDKLRASGINGIIKLQSYEQEFLTQQITNGEQYYVQFNFERGRAQPGLRYCPTPITQRGYFSEGTGDLLPAQITTENLPVIQCLYVQPAMKFDTDFMGETGTTDNRYAQHSVAGQQAKEQGIDFVHALQQHIMDKYSYLLKEHGGGLSLDEFYDKGASYTLYKIVEGESFSYVAGEESRIQG